MFLQILNAYSVNVDGFNNGDEWSGATVNQLISGESNCNINNAFVKTIFEPDENAVYFCFLFIDPTLESDNDKAGISIKIEDSESFDINASDSLVYFDNEKYSFEGAFSVDKNNGATSEIRVGFKFGLPQRINISVRFIDSEGNLSNVYPFALINDHYVETTELIISQTEAETERVTTTKATTTKAVRTTKEKTTKVKTTKNKTTTYKEEKRTEYTRKPKTTVTEKKKTEFYIQTSPPYSYVRKTRAPKTTGTSKATSLPGTEATNPAKAKVYYYEKEVIISEVYVSYTETTSHSDIKTTDVPATEITDIISTDIQSTTVENTFSVSKGSKYKVLIGALALISFTALAVGSTISSKKKTKNNDTEESQ